MYDDAGRFCGSPIWVAFVRVNDFASTTSQVLIPWSFPVRAFRVWELILFTAPDSPEKERPRLALGPRGEEKSGKAK